MRAWYCPSWNGDWRLEPDPNDKTKTRLSVEKPTPGELAQLGKLAPVLKAAGWLSQHDADLIALNPALVGQTERYVVIESPLANVGPLVTSILQPGMNILTAVRFRDGHVEVAETNAPPKEPSLDGGSYRTPTVATTEPSKEIEKIAANPKAEVAATVKRPTPCCPDCYVDAVGPATDVLLSFLDKEQHETWRKDRFLVVRGGITKHRYIIAHRNTPLATAQKRIAFDLEDGQVVHFHDWTVPPEEEVLAAMLILRHREPWLRNEATALGNFRHVFKNPFGDMMDGVEDSMWTQQVGSVLAPILG